MIDADQERIANAASIFGKKGGKSGGPKKARTPDHYSRIAKLGAAKKAANKAAREATKGAQ